MSDLACVWICFLKDSHLFCCSLTIQTNLNSQFCYAVNMRILDSLCIIVFISNIFKQQYYFGNIIIFKGYYYSDFNKLLLLLNCLTEKLVIQTITANFLWFVSVIRITSIINFPFKHQLIRRNILLPLFQQCNKNFIILSCHDLV